LKSFEEETAGFQEHLAELSVDIDYALCLHAESETGVAERRYNMIPAMS